MDDPNPIHHDDTRAEPVSPPQKTLRTGIRYWPARMRDWMFRHADKPNALWWLSGFAFAESSFFPLPPDILLIPIGAANPKKAIRTGLICTVASVLGGMAGYLIGVILHKAGGAELMQWFLGEDNVSKAERWYQIYGTTILFIAGVSPIPYKVFTITSGFMYSEIGFLPFVAISLASRGARFMSEAVLLRIFGKRIQYELEQRINLWSIVLLFLGIGGFLAIKLWR